MTWGCNWVQVWDKQTVHLPLAGTLASVTARGLFVDVQLGDWEPVRLAFAWAETSHVPLGDFLE